MARWRPRAVWFAVAVEVLLLFAVFLVPPYGGAATGVAAGFVAGALAGGGARPGARHGLATGVVGAALTVVVGTLVALTVGLRAVVLDPVEGWAPIAWWLDDLGGLPLVVTGALALLALAPLAGAIGGAVRGTAEFPGRIEQERIER